MVQILLLTISTIVIFSLCISVSYFLFRVFKYIRNNTESSRAMKKARGKTKILIYIVIIFWIILVAAFFSIIYPIKSQSPWIQLIYNIINDYIISILLYIGLFIFSKNYKFISYWQYIRFRSLTSGSKSTTNSTVIPQLSTNDIKENST